MVDFKLLSDPEYRENYRKRQEELSAKIEKEEEEFGKRLLELSASPRVNDWETKFLSSLITGFKANLSTRFDDLSERQKEVFKRIERKVYAAG